MMLTTTYNGTSNGQTSTVATFLKFWTMGVVLSSIAYGVAFTLSISTFHCLHSNTRGNKQRRHYVLISYILLMFCLSTVSIVSGIRTNLNAIAAGNIPAHIGMDENAIIVVLVTWLSDGFLLWRAAILYEGVKAVLRRTIQILVVFLMFSQIVCGILYILYNFIPALGPPKYSLPIFSAFASTTLSVNWIITALVVFRIGQFRYQASSSLGHDFGKPFKEIMTMCIESAALIIVFSTILLIQNLRGESPFSLSRLLLVQIYVIAPLLILYRVAQGKTFPTEVLGPTSFQAAPPSRSSLGGGSTTLRLPGSEGQSTGTLPSIIFNKMDEVTATHDDSRKTYLHFGEEMETERRRFRNEPIHIAL